MMKVGLICVGLFLTYCIDYTYTQHAICNSIEGYDTKSLVSAVQWQVTTDYQCLGHAAADCTFFITFCQTAPNCFNEYSACQNSSGATNMTIIGALSSSVFHENESGPKGFYAKFLKAPEQQVSNTTRCSPSLKIKFNCNLKAQWFVPIGDVTANAPQPTDIDVDDACLTTMTFDYPGACFHGKEPESGGISGGGVFLIILFSVLAVYFVGGMLYNGLVQHRSGIDLLPQAQFWIGLPLHIIQGCRATLAFCRCSSTPSPATYESV